nr:unnamed protein product [Spirometra erinaceieuropaei]
MVRMDDERLPKRLFYGDVATSSRRPGGQFRRYKDTLKSCLKHLQINPTNWEELLLDRPTWRRKVKSGAAIYEANRIAAAKVKREARKSQLRPVPLPSSPSSYTSSPASSSSCPIAPTTAALVADTHTSITHIYDTTTDTISPISDSRGEDQDFTCPHCDRTFTSHIDLVSHLRTHRTETGEPVPGAPTNTHRTRPRCPRTFVSLHAINFTLPEFWQHAPELYFIRIESAFYSANVTKELAKYHKLVEVLPASVISQVQSLLANPPADAPYSALMAEILRLNSVSDRQMYHQLIKEESLGDRKPSELLRRMRCLLGDMQVDDKFVKEMFLERLPTDVQTILASGSQDLSVSQLAEMADRMIEVQRFQSPSVAQISSSSSVNEHLLKQVSAMADEMASLKIQLARLNSSRSRSRRRSRSRPRTADTCWYHITFGVKARRCSSPCSFKPKQGNQSARE